MPHSISNFRRKITIFFCRLYRKSELRHQISSSDLLAAASSAVSSAKKRNVARLIKKFCVPRFQLIRRSKHRNQVAGELYGGFHIAVWPIQPDSKIDTIMHNDLLSQKNTCLCVCFIRLLGFITMVFKHVSVHLASPLTPISA